MTTRPAGPPPGQFMRTDIYARRRWRRVQLEQFWTRWREERVLAEPTAATKVDGDAAGPVRGRYRSCARRITTP